MRTSVTGGFGFPFGVVLAVAAAFTAQSRHDALVLLFCALGGILFSSMVRAARAPLHEREYDANVPAIPVQQPGRATQLAS